MALMTLEKGCHHLDGDTDENVNQITTAAQYGSQAWLLYHVVQNSKGGSSELRRLLQCSDPVSRFQGWLHTREPVEALMPYDRYDVPTIAWFFAPKPGMPAFDPLSALYSHVSNGSIFAFSTYTLPLTPTSILGVWAEHFALYVSGDPDAFSAKRLLANDSSDYVTHALVSSLLQFSDKELNTMAELHTEHREVLQPLLRLVIRERRQQECILKEPIMCVHFLRGQAVCRIPFIRTSIKVLTEYFRNRQEGIENVDDDYIMCVQPALRQPNTTFSLFNYKDIGSTISHLSYLLDLLRTDRLLCQLEVITSINGQTFCKSPVEQFWDSDSRFNWTRESSNVAKYITGQACCCKTTMFGRIQEKYKGVTFYSRGQVGTFAGKANSPMDVFGLHAALEYKLRQPGVIGDRGQIDNPLWRLIMTFLCPSKLRQNAEDLVREALLMLSSHINEYVIAYLSQQRVAIVIDPSRWHNKVRMFNRGEGQDYHRARIPLYGVMQAFFYYLVGMLFGWPVLLLPYSLRSGPSGGGGGSVIRSANVQDWDLDSSLITDWLVPTLANHFQLELKEKEGVDDTKNVSAAASKPSGQLNPDMTFAKQAGILK